MFSFGMAIFHKLGSKPTPSPLARSLGMYAIASILWIVGSTPLTTWINHHPGLAYLDTLKELIWLGVSCGWFLRIASSSTKVDLVPTGAIAIPTSAQPVAASALNTPAARPISPQAIDPEVYRDVQRALKSQEFRLCYQPIVALNSEQIVGFEALIRWAHPSQGELSPAVFMPVIEESDLVDELGEWVLLTACQQFEAWRQRYPKAASLMVSVNLSGRQFRQADLPQKVQRILQQTQLPSRCLKLEITETTVMENPERATQMLKQLHDMGLKLSIDDFGTGYSSLSYLYRFPVDILKIDRSFINHIDSDGEQVELVRTIAVLAWNLGLDTIAEGIENTMQLSQLRALQCTYGQGYLFSKPLEVDAVEAVLNKL